MDKKAETACFTGHREMKMATAEIKCRLSEVLDILIAKGVIYYGCGGAWGFDFLAAETVIKKKRLNPKVNTPVGVVLRDRSNGAHETLKWCILAA